MSVKFGIACGLTILVFACFRSTEEPIPSELATSKEKTVLLSVDGMGWVTGRFEAVQSALANTSGISDLRIPGQKSRYPDVQNKGQIIQYTGYAKPEDVIALLHKNTFFKAEVAKIP